MSNILYEAMKRAGWGDTQVKKNSKKLKLAKSDKYNETLTEQKTAEEVRKLKITNERDLGKLIEKKTVKAVLSKYSELIQVYFVQLPRREATNIVAELGIEGKEKKLESMLGEAIEKGLDICRNELKKIKGSVYWR